MSEVPKMCTIQQAADATGMSYDCIRKMCLRKQIIHIKVGKKILVNMDRFIEFLNGEQANKEPAVEPIKNAPI